jgi:prolycopene isomerase
MKKYDIIIIGAGLGGLSIGAMLAKKDKKVLVLEKHYQVGGYATNFKRGDFIFDASLHATGGVKKTDYHKILKKCGVFEKIKFIKLPEIYTSIFPDFKFTFKNGDIEQVKKDLIVKFPKEKIGIKLWFYFIKKINKENKLWQKYKNFIVFIAPIIIPILMFSHKIPLSFFLNLAIRDKKLKALLTQLWPYWGLPPKKLASQYFLIPAYGYFYDGAYYLKGGAQIFSNAFREVIEENNGVVQTSIEVIEILVKNEKAIGVKTKDGNIYFADKIISNVSPFLVYENFLSKWKDSQKELEKIKKMELSISATQFYFGLDTSIVNLNPKFKNAYEVFVNLTYDYDKIYREFLIPSFKREYLSFNMTFYSNIDSGLAPINKSVMSIIVGDNYERWKNLSNNEYKIKKKEETEKIIKLAEKYLPELRKHIEVLEVATPKTMKRYTGNPEGAIYGFAQTILQCGF